MGIEKPYRYHSIMAFTVIAIILLFISPLLYVVNIKVDRVKAKYNEVEATKSEVITAKTLAENNIFKVKCQELSEPLGSWDELDIEIEEAEETEEAETNTDENEGEQ